MRKGVRTCSAPAIPHVTNKEQEATQSRPRRDSPDMSDDERDVESDAVGHTSGGRGVGY